MDGDESASSTPVELKPGRILQDRYVLVRLAGTGGMAQVWEATDRVLGRRVAIKLLHSHLASANSIERFRQEGVAAAKLTHPNVVSIYDTIPVDRSEALVMEFVEGHTMRTHLDRHGTISQDDATAIGTAVAGALDAAHRSGVVHRDVKPANILLCRNGQVKITDFGIAKAAEGEGLTKEGTLVGTAAYLAPEQLDGGPVDGRADIYALGLVLYESVCGRPAFTGDTDAAVALARLRVTPPAPHRVNKDISPEFSKTIMRAMARKPESRFQTAAQFKAALSDPPKATPRPPAPSPVSSDSPTSEHDEDEFVAPDRRWVVPVVVTVTVLIAALLALTLLSGNTAKKPPPTTAAVPAAALPIVSATSVDPQGDTGSENESLVGRSYDGDPQTEWRTEGYDSPTFAGTDKTGVGISWTVATASRFQTLAIDSPNSGWSASVYVVDQLNPSTFDPTALKPAATRDGLEPGSNTFDLHGARGTTVVLWITNLGKGSGRIRVAVTEAALTGNPG